MKPKEIRVVAPGDSRPSTPARYMPGMRAYPTIVRMFSFGTLLAGLGLALLEEDRELIGWAKEAGIAIGGPHALGIVMILSAALSFGGQCAERYGRVFGMCLSGPLFVISFLVAFGAARAFVVGPPIGRPSAGMVLGLAAGYFVVFTNVYVVREIQVRITARRSR